MGMRILGWVMAVLLAGAAFAAGPDFEGLDRNKNGTLEKAEIEAAAPEILKKYDINKDGSLDRKEFEAAGGAPARFDLLDRNKNGLLDLDELKQSAAARFKEFDTNRDGRIDTSEWQKLQKKPVPQPMINLFYF
jgi:hypothetical protein